MTIWSPSGPDDRGAHFGHCARGCLTPAMWSGMQRRSPAQPEIARASQKLNRVVRCAMCFTTCKNYPMVYTLRFENPEFLLLKTNNFNTKLYLTKLRFGALQGQIVEEPVLVIRQIASKFQAAIQSFQAVQNCLKPSRTIKIRSRAASRTLSLIHI